MRQNAVNNNLHTAPLKRNNSRFRTTLAVDLHYYFFFSSFAIHGARCETVFPLSVQGQKLPRLLRW